MKLWVRRWAGWYQARSSLRAYQAIRTEAVQLSGFQPARQTLETLLGHLDISRFSNYRVSDAIGIEIQPYYPCLDRYHLELKRINARLAVESVLPAHWPATTPVAMTLDRFFESQDGYYVNVPEHLARFKEDALILCRLMRMSDGARYGVHEHNLRMLTILLANLRELVITLIDLSHEISHG